MKISALLWCACLLLRGAAVKADNPQNVLTIKKIVPGVWFLEGSQGVYNNQVPNKADGLANSIIIEMKDYLVVVDAGYPDGARAVIREARELSSKPIKYVIDTHWHPDHAYGNHVFTEIGATTIASVGAWDQIKQWEPQSWQSVARGRQDVRDMHMSAPEPPELLYTRSPYVISDGTRRIELYHFGYGHTESDTFIYLPKEKVLCTGDAVVNGPFSDPKNAYMHDWIKEIQAAEKLDVEYVLPGHGDPAGKELIAEELDFFQSLYKAVQSAIQRGETLDQLVTIKNNRPVATSLKLSSNLMQHFVFKPSPNLTEWARSRFPNQVKDVYLEITKGLPYAELCDPTRFGARPNPCSEGKK
jgi:cyclase